MTITIQAIYEGGVFRRVQPLPIADGELVDLTVAMPIPAGREPKAMTPAEQDYAHRLAAAKTLDEMFAVMATAPPFPEGYDLQQALIDNRKATVV